MDWRGKAWDDLAGHANAHLKNKTVLLILGESLGGLEMGLEWLWEGAALAWEGLRRAWLSMPSSEKKFYPNQKGRETKASFLWRLHTQPFARYIMEPRDNY